MGYDTYVLILCAIVYTFMTILTIAVITALTKTSLKLIRHGAEDENILKENLKAQKKKRKNSGKLDWLVSAFFCLIFSCAFGFSLYVNINQNVYFESVPTLKVVNTDSMSKKLDGNKYLFNNNLNDQFAALDVIFVYKLPDPFALELYDVVVYEVDDMLIVHRIVGIEEPNAKHPNERHFLLQGDAVENPDRFPVRYSQMRAIYRGQKVPFVGSFILFMQSPAGWLCMILMIAATIAAPIIDRKLEKAREERYVWLCQNTNNRISPTHRADIFSAPIYLYPVYYDPAQGTPSPIPNTPPTPSKTEGKK